MDGGCYNSKHPFRDEQRAKIVISLYSINTNPAQSYAPGCFALISRCAVRNACETGLGDIVGNEGVYGLQRAFRIAGAKNVLMSLWKVPDDATEKLMTRFYSNWLAEKKPLRASFEEAQEWLRGQKGFENPYFWAGFVLVGDL